jgi:superfamily II DNA helicase RecQ
VAFVMGNRRAFQGVPLGVDWQDRVGPLVSGADDASVLPASTRRLIKCAPSPAEVALLASTALALTTARAELARAEATGAPGPDRNRLRHLAQVAFERARLAGTDPAGVTGDSSVLAQAVGSPSKRAALARLCADGAPTVVCCDSAIVAQAVAASLQDAGITAAALTGALTREAQSQTVQMLGNGLTVLVTASVGQMGWNLQAASRVVHYDVPLTPAAARQREGRVRRVGASASQAVCLLLTGAVDTDAALAWASSSVDEAGL